jgi:hypothetical protein
MRLLELFIQNSRRQAQQLAAVVEVNLRRNAGEQLVAVDRQPGRGRIISGTFEPIHDRLQQGDFTDNPVGPSPRSG